MDTWRGAVPSTLHQRIAIWRKDGLVENIEADQSYFLAEVNNITKKNIDKKLAFIPPVMSLGPKYTVSKDEMCNTPFSQHKKISQNK